MVSIYFLSAGSNYKKPWHIQLFNAVAEVVTLVYD